jgi:Domain of unknown function (DUF4349)
MRLSEMGPGRDDAPLPAEVEAELSALDAALAGDDVPAGMEGLEALVSDLRAERSAPESEFGDALDRWAAAGFPRGRRPGLSPKATASDAGGRFRLFMASLTPRKLAYAGGAAATLVVLVVGVSQIDFQGSMDEDDSADSGGSTATEEVAPSQAEPSDGAPGLLAPGAREKVAPEASDDVVDRAGLRALGNDRGSDYSAASRPGPAGGQEERRVERDAQMTLAAPADEVQDVTNEAITVVESNRGVVESSQTSGTEDQARATLQLVIPTRTLDITLDQLSDLADVKSLSEGTVDITRPFVDAKDELAGLRAERVALINQIQAADTEEELDQLRARLDVLLNTIAQAEADFDNIQRRAALSNVTLQITSEGADEGDWSFDEAIDDAGRVLEVGAGIALIAGAVLLPLALVGAIIYFVMSAARNRARERALDE